MAVVPLALSTVIQACILVTFYSHKCVVVWLRMGGGHVSWEHTASMASL